MTREMIEETYNMEELLEKRSYLKKQLQSAALGEDEKWELNHLLEAVNKRIRLMNDLLVEIQPTF